MKPSLKIFVAVGGRRSVNVTRTRLSESRKQPAKIPERQPREQGATGRNAGSIVLAGSGIARSMDSAAREQLAARRTRCASARGSRAPRFASAAVRERHGSHDIKAMWRAGGDAAALTRTTRRSGGGARGQSPPANVHEPTCQGPGADLFTCRPVVARGHKTRLPDSWTSRLHVAGHQ